MTRPRGTRATCPHCHWRSDHPSHESAKTAQEHHQAEAHGIIPKWQRSLISMSTNQGLRRPCPDCQGFGAVKETKCWSCNGSGKRGSR